MVGDRSALLWAFGLAVGARMTMSTKPPAISFHDLTLGYDRHPAVHHITGEVDQRRAARACRAERRRQVDLAQGHHRASSSRSTAAINLDGLTKHDIAYLPQQIDIDRSFPITVFDCRGHGAVARDRRSGAASTRGANAAVAGGARHARPARPRRSARRRAVGRTVPARAVRAPALARRGLILLDEPFRAVDTKTVDDLCA